MAFQPAKKFGLDGAKGQLAVGYDADIVIADPAAPWTITNDGVLSRCGWTPYDGREISAQIDATFVRGEPVFANGEVVATPGQGRIAVPRTS
jgi:dihydroorotase-like cyclic amidohydrolase